ncbi:hypothetical protein UFOVP115_117 [uncultured Caudovirales phage]|uniref:Uncharacterized protein n=1 Tax=uncultured Caudovirales phage TaxID=2100421 RepID=A0A6J5L960_9CAUD|nr:hypothetical protein UFOVP115_117 [uncultured Caudovirales phage]
MAENIESSMTKSTADSADKGFTRNLVGNLFPALMIRGKSENSGGTSNGGNGSRGGRQFAAQSEAYKNDLNSHLDYLKGVNEIGQGDRTHAAETLKDLAEHGHIISEGAANNKFTRDEAAKNNAVTRNRKPVATRTRKKPTAREVAAKKTSNQVSAAATYINPNAKGAAQTKQNNAAASYVNPNA